MQEHPAAEYTPPLTFARDVLQVRLWDKQQQVLAALAAHRRVAVKSGNGLGKGFCAAAAVLWFIYCHDPAIVLSTAPTFRQVRHVLWRQVRRLYRPAKDMLGGSMFETRWELAEDRYAMGLSAGSADEFQGFHCPHMLIVVDEAEGVSDEIYEGIESVMTSAEPRLLLIGNPTTISGAFRRAFHEERRLYHTITISALDSPNVRENRIVVAGLTTAQWVEERRDIWGEKNPIYRARVLGEFPDQEEDTLISLSALEAAADEGRVDYEVEGASGDLAVLAVDVARYGSDRSVILRRRGNIIEDIQALRNLDTMELAGRVAAAARDFRPDYVCIDEIGIGAGVVDRLTEEGYPVRGINVARSAREKGRFVNLRTEGYWRLRDLFAAGQIRIPPDNELIGELAAIKYSFDNLGRVRLESKDAMRKRNLPSPDKADALMLAFVEPPAKVKVWT